VVKPYTYTPESKASMLAASRKPKGKRTKHKITCANCGTVKHDPSYGRERVSGLAFCSLACCNAYRVGENNPAWRGGHDKYYGPSWRPARRAARKRDGHRCRRCGAISERAVDVHHVVPFNTFTSHEEANRLVNLVSLCHPCHMLVEWHGIDFAL
jgi:hypothetical protein